MKISSASDRGDPDEENSNKENSDEKSYCEETMVKK